MLIWQASLLAQQRQGITAPLRVRQLDLTRPAQTVNHEKDLVPCEGGAASRHVFEVARAELEHYLDHLIFRCSLLSHIPPLLKNGMSC